MTCTPTVFNFEPLNFQFVSNSVLRISNFCRQNAPPTLLLAIFQYVHSRAASAYACKCSTGASKK